MRKFKRLTMTLALLIMAVTGAWADEAKVYTEAVAFNSLKAGDVLTDGFSITKNIGEYIKVKGYKKDSGTAETEEYSDPLDACTYPGGVVITVSGYGISGNYTPYADGKDANAWIVSKKEVNGSATMLYLDGYNYLPAIDLKPDDTGKNWILAEMPASNIELQVEYEPTKVTMAANDKTMGTVEVGGESKVEWTADTWQGWTSNDKEHTVDDITMTSSDGSVYEYTYDYSGGKYKNSLNFFVDQWEDNSTVTFSTTGAPFSRIEFTMIDNYSEYTPNIKPNDNWTFEGKSAVWEGEATKSLTLQSCSTYVSKITFFQGGVPDGVTVNTDGTFTVAKTATVTLKATPAEGYKFLYWEDDQTNTNPVREVTIESGLADMTYKAVFAEILYNVTFADGIEDADKWKAEPNAAAKNTEIKVTYSGAKKVIGVKAEKKKAVTSKLASEVTSDDIFKVIASDGMIYDNIAAAESAGTVAQGLVVYVGSGTGNDTYTHGMALALKDEGDYTWSGAKNACNAKNTSTPIVGALWIQASKDQWITMFNAVGGDCKLRDCFASAGGTNLKKVENYWAGSSHEESGEQGDYYTFSDSNLSGTWCSTSVIYNNPYLVRPCIVF